jgi:hypothetical protein
LRHPERRDEGTSGHSSRSLPEMLWELEKTLEPMYSGGTGVLWRRSHRCILIFKYTYFIKLVSLLIGQTSYILQPSCATKNKIFFIF